ncbi:Hsp33 family molecular chaperone HslO [Denitrobaculum tricleocarpae]|uniref:Molecular chaperone Hsp33 n=1 Tax=Denitrobaculum tricleocarpae TaxID=2591009 RepID=A0A545T815_9PROT|nr:Hsp33 family molecular chaperone HslO [Denitrobaculum tricleocarpae]TQV73342.1 molecular chaperone Hsp33 [Denitrobaculum tricleocarpae]
MSPDSGSAGDPGENPILDDLVQPFILETSGIRGRLVKLGESLDAILGRHDYPRPVATALGELLLLASVLSSMLKFSGVFTLQVKGDGPVNIMVADITSEGELRGYAGFDAGKIAALDAVPPESGGRQSVPALLGKGYLAFTVDQRSDSDRYQGIVELDGESLADCLLHYFRQSEQIQTGLLVTVGQDGEGRWRGGGLGLQHLPDEAKASGQNEDLREEDWRRSMILQASCTEAELLDADLPANDLLFRLFHEEGVRVFERRAIAFGCRCSSRRLEAVLAQMPREEVETLKVDGVVVATCEFCSTDYRYDDAALDRLYE